jgi:EAL domain-containing protein (putative c-di-GMP-specific phosphodiesterase class I)
MGVCPVTSKGHNLPTAVACAGQALEAIANDNSAHSEIIVYDSNFEATIKERHELEKLLESVDIEQNFVPFYQSKVDIRTNAIVGAEALVRFRDPTANGALKSPAYFVPYYEQTGRIVEVDFFILESACKLLRSRIDAGKPVVPISCNFSRMHFIKPGFTDRFEAVLNKYELSKELIEVEVTETMIVEDLQQYNVKNVLAELKSKGIRLSIDDFGSGYSSLGTFELVPASVVKLDRSFLLNYEDRDRQVKIMRNIVKMSEDLDFQIVCEGVETEEQNSFVDASDCDYIQGWYYSTALSEEKAEIFAREYMSNLCFS